MESISPIPFVFMETKLQKGLTYSLHTSLFIIHSSVSKGFSSSILSSNISKIPMDITKPHFDFKLFLKYQLSQSVNQYFYEVCYILNCFQT